MTCSSLQIWYPLSCTDSFCKRRQGSGRPLHPICFGSAVGDTTMLASTSMSRSGRLRTRLSLLTANFQLRGSPSGRHSNLSPAANLWCVGGGPASAWDHGQCRPSFATGRPASVHQSTSNGGPAQQMLTIMWLMDVNKTLLNTYMLRDSCASVGKH